MRFRKIDRYLLLLAALFVLAVLKRTDLPGEEVLPDVYHATIHQPLLAQASAAANDDALDIVALKSEVAAKEREIRQLRQQLETTREQAGYLHELRWEATPEPIDGWVFAVDANPFRRMFKIDLGTTDRVEAGMPVVTGKALLGTIAHVLRRQSVVLRVDDPNFSLEVEIHPSGGGADVQPLAGVALGDGGRLLEVRYVRNAKSLRVGDPVYTTSYHKLIPPGLVVGWVAEVEDLDQDGTAEVKVTPAAALGRWAQITVLKRKER